MHILIVGADTATSGWLEDHLKRWRHSVSVVPMVRRALEMVEGQGADAIIAAMPQPDMEADAFCRQLREHNGGQNPRLLVLLNRLESDGRLDELLQSGMDDYITIPLDAAALRVKLAAAEQILNLKMDLHRQLLVIRRTFHQTIQTLVRVIENSNESLGAHCRRVGKLALALAKRHDRVAAEDYLVIEAAGMLHDIGMVGLPDTIINKRRTELVDNESSLYRAHSERGESVLSQLDMLRPVARLVRSHHEQHNGRGFPDGLAGDRIPLGAAIVAAASLYDDLVHRERTPYKRIPEQLQQYRGYQLQPEMVGLLLEANLVEMQDDARRTDRAVSIEALTSSMVLDREVLMKSGAACMAANTALNDDLIEKLKRYHEMGNISGKVFVKK